MTQDELTVIAYAVVLIAVRNASAMLALLVMLIIAYTAMKLEFKYPIDDVYLFPVIGSAYLICAKIMRSCGCISWIGCILMSLYSFYYSYDCWMNGEVKTWVYRNHESIILIIHAFIMLLLSKAQLAVVSARLNLFWNNHCNRKDKRDS